MFFKHPKSKKVIRRMDEILKDRFGIPFHHMNCEGVGYAIYTAPPSNYNVLNRNIEDMYKYTSMEVDPSDDIDDIDDADDNPRKVYGKWLTDVESITKKLNTDGVYIDLHKARITGLPKEYKLMILTDLELMINSIKLTARELVAVLLHEIGHGFTHLEYSYRGYTVTNVLVDTLKDNLLKKNKSTKETIYLTYKELGGKEDISKDNVTVATIKLMVLLKESFVLKDTESAHSYSDSEQLADQFSGRFGLSAELASGLDKVTEKFKISNNPALLLPLLLMFIYVMLILTFMVGPVGAVIIIFMSIIYTIVIDAIVSMGNSNVKLTYDDMKQRVQRQLNEQIRQLRLLDLDKKETKAAIERIELIKDIVDKYKKPSVGPVDRIVRFITSPVSSKYVNYKEMEQLIENLSENELHVSGRKLKTLV